MQIPDVERIVKGRYSDAAQAPQTGLCCPSVYDPELLRSIPDEVLERDYGCGNPSRHLIRRGVRTAVCEKTFRYGAHFEPIPPRVLLPLSEAAPFPCGTGARVRDPRETKGDDYRVTSEACGEECC